METSLLFSCKNVNNFNKVVKVILCFCKNTPKKPDDQTEFWGWKHSLRQMENYTIIILVQK